MSPVEVEMRVHADKRLREACIELAGAIREAERVLGAVPTSEILAEWLLRPALGGKPGTRLPGVRHGGSP